MKKIIILTFLIMNFINAPLNWSSSGGAAEYSATSPALNTPTNNFAMYFDTGVVPVGSSVELEFTVTVNTSGDNRDHIYCGNQMLVGLGNAYPIYSASLPATVNYDVSSCVAGRDLSSEDVIVSTNAWNYPNRVNFMYGSLTFSNITLRVTPPTYTVTYNGNGADSGTPPTDANTYPQGAAVTVLGNTGTLAKSGYTFSGWNTASDGSGTTYQPADTFNMGILNVTLYAVWSAQITKLQDFSSSTALTDNFTEGTNGSGTPFVRDSATGLGGGGGILVSTLSADQIWTTKESYTVTSSGVYIMSAYFKMGANSGYGALGFSTESINSALGSNGMPGSGNFIGISFHGGGGNWLNNSLGGSLSWAGGDMIYSPATWYFFELVVEAKASNNFDLTFRIKNSDSNGNIGTLHTEHTTTINNSNIASASNLYVFFSADGSRAAAIDNFTIQLSGGADISYSVTYDGNGADSGLPPTDANTYLQGSTVTILGNTGTLAKSGYTFDGWNTASDGSGTTYLAGNTFSMGSSNITLYAVWTSSGPTATAPASGDGTSGNPYQIATLENLYWIAADSSRWSYNYIQTADIDASGTSTWDSGSGWTPIGNNTTKFTGSYDGNNMRISNLYINRPGISYVGLFGYIEASSKYFKKIIIDGGNITGGVPTGAIAGALFYGIMEDCSSSAAVTGTSNIGGLAGQLVSNSSTNGIIRRCSSSGSVTASGQAGGLVGLNQANGDAGIHQSFATGNVNIGTGNKAGGLVGYNGYGSIRNSYSTGTVTGGSEIGGFIGYSVGIASSYISYNYSIGQVVASGALKGGFIGSEDATNKPTYADNFWDITTSGQATSQGAGATGKTSAEMKQMVTFTNWDFPATWHIDESVASPDNNGYPSLAWQGLTHYVSAANYTITASKTGTGSGTITSSPAGISCGVDCSESVLQGTDITLTAAADSGSTFTGWSGGDCAGNGNCTVTVNSDLTITGNFGTSTTERGYALSFDGSDDYVDLEDDADLEFTGSMTIEAWIKPSPQSTISTIASKKYPGGANTGYSFFINNWGSTDRRLIFESQDKLLQTDENAVNFNQWQHVAVTVSGGTVGKLYINGVEQSATGEVGLTADTANPFQIGAMSSLYPFIGEIDEFRVWNVARSQAEIQANKDVELSGSESGLLIYYNFNQGTPGGDNSGLNTVYNKAGSDKNGTLTNFALNGSSSNWVMVSPNTYTVTYDGNVADSGSPPTDANTYSQGSTVTVLGNTGSLAKSGYSFGGWNTAADGSGTTYQAGNTFAMGATNITLYANWLGQYALQFDGNSYVEIADNSTLDLIDNYTIEAWIKPASFEWLGGIVGKYHNSGSNGYTLRLSLNSPYSGINFDEMSTDEGIFTLNQWQHIAAVNDNGTRKVYVNGVEQTLSGTPSYTVEANTDPLVIGTDFLENPRYFNGLIDEVRVWNVARSQADIVANMNTELTGSESGLVAYYKMNEGAGTSLDDGSPNSNTGTVNGATWVISDCFVPPSTYTVTGTARYWSGGGTVTPASQSVNQGSTATLTITPAAGSSLSTATGCGGSLAGNTYTTGAINADCEVIATFSLNSYTVGASVSGGTGGTISPSSRAVKYNSPTTFTITPDWGYHIDSVSGCSGTLSGNIYTTGSVTGACDVTVSFSLNSYTVNASATAHGTITPSGDSIVNHGNITSFTITPDAGYDINYVLGCGGSVSGTSPNYTYTTGAVTGNCKVMVFFKSL